MPRHYANISQSRFMLDYLRAVLDHAPRGSHTLDAGTGSGIGPIWLSLRGVRAEGIELAPTLIEEYAARVPGTKPSRNSYQPGLTAIVHTLNEEQRLDACLDSLDWVDELIVCDMESTDGTRQIAESHGAIFMTHPPLVNFDRARNVSALRAQHQWVLYVDADERIPSALAATLRTIIEQAEPDLAGVRLPFRHYFSGEWLRSLYPGYTAPRLLRNGEFFFNTRVHTGVAVSGRIVDLTVPDPALAIEHRSFDSISHYLKKLNRYTDAEALNLDQTGAGYSWQGAVRQMMLDIQMYFAGMENSIGAGHDNTRGFLYSVLSGFYRFVEYAKLWERHDHAGTVAAQELSVPPILQAMLEDCIDIASHAGALQGHCCKARGWSQPFATYPGSGRTIDHNSALGRRSYANRSGYSAWTLLSSH